MHYLLPYYQYDSHNHNKHLSLVIKVEREGSLNSFFLQMRWIFLIRKIIIIQVLNFPPQAPVQFSFFSSTRSLGSPCNQIMYSNNNRNNSLCKIGLVIHFFKLLFKIRHWRCHQVFDIIKKKKLFIFFNLMDISYLIDFVFFQ